MESRRFSEQGSFDPQQLVSAGSNSQLQRASPCPNHFQDSTVARTVLAVILEIITDSGDDLNQLYPSFRPCPMLKCFHSSATPLELIRHITTCSEAAKGEIRCYTCRRCHNFKRWHVCSTLKSPVDLLRRLSNRKRGSNSSAGEPSATKRGKIVVGDDFPALSQQESHGFETVWPYPELEGPTGLFVSELTSSSGAAQLHANEERNMCVPELGGSSSVRTLPTPPSTRNHSWSEDSQNLVAYGDAEDADVPEPPPPYLVSPETTVDDYQCHLDQTDSLRLGIPPVQYIHESSLMASPEDLDFPEAGQAPWADYGTFSQAQDPQVNFRLAPTDFDANISPPESISSETLETNITASFASSQRPNPRRHKQSTWPVQPDRAGDTPGLTFDRHQPQILGDISRLADTAPYQSTGTKASITRHASFDAGAQDSITVSTLEDRASQVTSRAARLQKNHHHNNNQYEECDLCGQKFGGIPKNRKQHLKRHVESKHGGALFPCGHAGCVRHYNRVDNLHDHERKRHGFVMQGDRGDRGGGGGLPVTGGSAVAELAADDVEIRQGGRGQYGLVSTAAEVEGSAADVGDRRALPGAVDPHVGVFGYSFPAEGRRTAGLPQDEWGALLAGVSGGQGETSGQPNVGHEAADTRGGDDDGLSIGVGLAPRPLDLPCTSWRAL